MALIDFTQIKGGKAVVDQVNNLVTKSDVVTTEKAGSAAASDNKVMSEAAVVQQFEEMQAGVGLQVKDEVAVNGAQATTEFNTSCTPTDDKLAMSINSVVYVEGKHFTVDRSAKKVTWTYTAANGGFDINGALTDSVKLTYFTRESTTLQVTTSLPMQVGTLIYTGGEQLPTWTAYDDKQLRVNCEPKVNAGEYTAAFTPVGRYVWADGTKDAQPVSWSIGKAAGTMNLDKNSLSLTTETPSDTVTVMRAGTGAVSAVSTDNTVASVTVDGTMVTVTGQKTGSTNVTVSVAADNNHTAPAAAVLSADVALSYCFGMVLVQEGNRTGKWRRVDKNFNIVPFNAAHGTWAGMKQVQDATYGEFTEIPITYVKTETLQSGPYAGKNCWWVADYPADGFHVHPAFIGQDGQPHNLQIASWIASNKNNVPFSEDKGNSRNGYWNYISYNTVHSKGWMAGGCRPYNIYDHHLLARLMLVEFGTPDVQAQTVDGVAWKSTNRISYHGIHDPFGLPTYEQYYWLDGLTILRGTYQVLAANGSRNMVETGISGPDAGVWPVNCRLDQVNGIDFGDLFIANTANSTESAGSFADHQSLNSCDGVAFGAYWSTSSSLGAFSLGGDAPGVENSAFGWRVARCV